MTVFWSGSRVMTAGGFVGAAVVRRLSDAGGDRDTRAPVRDYDLRTPTDMNRALANGRSDRDEQDR